jgi:hypothetical protein
MDSINQKEKQIEDDIKLIQKLPDSADAKQEMILALLQGKSFLKAIRHTRAKIARDQKNNGITPAEFSKSERLAGKKHLCPNFVSLEKQGTEEDMAEKIDFRRSRAVIFSDEVESFFDLLSDGIATLADSICVSESAARKDVQKLTELIENQTSFLSVEERAEFVANVLGRKREIKSVVGRKTGVEKAAVAAEIGMVTGDLWGAR